MRGFITDYLPPNPSNWECIEDFCGYGYDHCQENYCAYYSPSLKLVKFGGDWIEVKDMPSDKEPTEEQIYKWVDKDKCNYSRKKRAYFERKKNREMESNKTSEYFAKNGYNYVTIVYKNGSDFTYLIRQQVGKYNRMEVARIAIRYMLSRLSPNTYISLFKWESGLTELEVWKRNKRS